MEDVFVFAGVTVLKLITFVYDIVSFVPYYFIYRPDMKASQSKRLKAKSIGDESGPYRALEAVDGLSTQLHGCDTLDDLFSQAVQQHSDKKCLGYRELLREEDEKQPNGKVFKKVMMGEYQWMNYDQVCTKATNFGSGLLALGKTPRQNICIFAETSPWWMVAAQACFKYNFPIVTLYSTLGPDAIVHGINEAEVTYIITSAPLLPKFKGLMDRIPKVTHIIYIPGQKPAKDLDLPKHVKVLSMEEVENEGALPDNLKTPVTKPKRSDIALIMYTSGSTGTPKVIWCKTDVIHLHDTNSRRCMTILPGLHNNAYLPHKGMEGLYCGLSGFVGQVTKVKMPKRKRKTSAAEKKLKNKVFVWAKLKGTKVLWPSQLIDKKRVYVRSDNAELDCLSYTEITKVNFERQKQEGIAYLKRRGLKRTLEEYIEDCNEATYNESDAGNTCGPKEVESLPDKESDAGITCGPKEVESLPDEESDAGITCGPKEVESLPDKKRDAGISCGPKEVESLPDEESDAGITCGPKEVESLPDKKSDAGISCGPKEVESLPDKESDAGITCGPKEVESLPDEESDAGITCGPKEVESLPDKKSDAGISCGPKEVESLPDEESDAGITCGPKEVESLPDKKSDAGITCGPKEVESLPDEESDAGISCGPKEVESLPDKESDAGITCGPKEVESLPDEESDAGITCGPKEVESLPDKKSDAGISCGPKEVESLPDKKSDGGSTCGPKEVESLPDEESDAGISCGPKEVESLPDEESDAGISCGPKEVEPLPDKKSDAGITCGPKEVESLPDEESDAGITCGPKEVESLPDEESDAGISCGPKEVESLHDKKSDAGITCGPKEVESLPDEEGDAGITCGPKEVESLPDEESDAGITCGPKEVESLPDEESDAGNICGPKEVESLPDEESDAGITCGPKEVESLPDEESDAGISCGPKEVESLPDKKSDAGITCGPKEVESLPDEESDAGISCGPKEVESLPDEESDAGISCGPKEVESLPDEESDAGITCGPKEVEPLPDEESDAGISCGPKEVEPLPDKKCDGGSTCGPKEVESLPDKKSDGGSTCGPKVIESIHVKESETGNDIVVNGKPQEVKSDEDFLNLKLNGDFICDWEIDHILNSDDICSDIDDPDNDPDYIISNDTHITDSESDYEDADMSIEYGPALKMNIIASKSPPASPGSENSSQVSVLLSSTKMNVPSQSMKENREEYNLSHRKLSDEECTYDSSNPRLYIKTYKPNSNVENSKHGRSYDTVHSCLFCGTLVTNLQIHIENKHKNEEKVKEILKLKQERLETKEEAIKKTITERIRKAQDLLRHEGNHKHNEAVIKQGEGEILLSRRKQNVEFKLKDYGPCTQCYEWMLLELLTNHRKSCAGLKGNTSSIKKTKGVAIIESQVLKGKLHKGGSKRLIKDVFPTMSRDEVSEIAQNDELICALGDVWLMKTFDNKLRYKNSTSFRMRLAARLLILMRADFGDECTMSMSEFITVENFDRAVKCSLQICDEDEKADLKNPSTAIKLGYDMARLAALKESLGIKTKDVNMKTEAADYHKLLKMEWGYKVSKIAKSTLDERNFNKHKGLPDPLDIANLAKFLVDKIQTLDLQKCGEAEFREVAIVTSARLLLYNRRRPGELEGFRIDAYKKRSTTLDEGDLSLRGTLTDWEKHLLETQDLVTVRGKRGKGVPILIPMETKEALEYLANQENRRKGGVKPENPYMFANKGEYVIRAGDALEDVKMRTGANLKYPEKIYANNLRKMTATIAQAVSLNDQQMKWLCNHLGHTGHVHEQYYRQTSGLIERVEIAKLMLIQEHNVVGQFRNKNLSDIQFEDIVKYGEVEEEQVTDTADIHVADTDDFEEEDDDEPKKKTTRQKWSKDEEDEIYALFEDNFKQNKYPGLKKCTEVKETSKRNNGLLWKRSWETIKKKVIRMVKNHKEK